MIVEESRFVRIAASARDATMRSVRQSRAAGAVHRAKRRVEMWPAGDKIVSVIVAAGVAVLGFAVGARVLPASQRPSIPLAGGVLLALIGAALTAPFRE